MYAPKTQTKFKEFAIVAQSVESVRKQNNDLILYGGLIMAAGTASTMVKAVEKTPYVGQGIRYATGVGGIVYIIGTIGNIKLQDFQDDALIKHKIYFKWDNPEKLEYSVKIESWVEYKGKIVSKKNTYSYSKTL